MVKNVLILGIPNIGKSYLANILSREDQNGLSWDEVGTTVDFIQYEYKYNLNIKIFDSPGWVKENLINKFYDIEKSIDYIFFLKQDTQLNNLENEICNYIRKTNLNWKLLDNNYNIGEIFTVLDELEEKNEEQILSNKIIVSIVGRSNVGKSTLFNALLNLSRSTVKNEIFTTRDMVSHDLKIENNNILLQDTSGFCTLLNTEYDRFLFKNNKKIITNSNIIIILINGELTHIDLTIISNCEDLGIPYVIINNKETDFLASKNLYKIKKKNYLEIKMIKDKNNSNIWYLNHWDREKIYNILLKIITCINTSFPTYKLNKLMAEQFNKTRSIKLKYLVHTNNKPHTFKINCKFTNKSFINNIKNSLKSVLFPKINIPVKIIFI